MKTSRESLEKILRNSIDFGKKNVFIRITAVCAFLNDENLCDLYNALGPDALCDTCRMYPRHTEEYEGLRELSLSLSCPEAAKIILSCKEPVRFLEEETEEEDDFEEFDFMMFSQLEDTRDVLFAVLQDRSLPLTLRISVSEQLTESYQNCIEEGRQFDIDDLLRECERHQKEAAFRNLSQNIFLKKEQMQPLSINGIDRKRTAGTSRLRTSSSRVESDNSMEPKSGSIRRTKKLIKIFAKNFTKCMEH